MIEKISKEKEKTILKNDYYLTKEKQQENFNNLKKDLELILKNKNNLVSKIEKCKPETFEKDDDTNYHVLFILQFQI